MTSSQADTVRTVATTTRTKRAALVRLRPDDLIRMVAEAKVLVAPEAEAKRQAQIADYQTYLKYLEEIEDIQSVEEVTNEMRAYEEQIDASARPRWWFSLRKGQGMESDSGEAEDIAPRLSVPKPHNSVSVRITGVRTASKSGLVSVVRGSTFGRKTPRGC